MNSEKRKKLAIALIKNDLVHNKLIKGLGSMGIDASGYYLYLSEPIFGLIGFQEKDLNDELYDHYTQLFAKAEQLTLTEAWDEFERLAQEVYEELKVKLGDLPQK